MKKEDVQKKMKNSGVISYNEDGVKKKLSYTTEDKIVFHKDDVEIENRTQLVIDYILYKEITSIKEK